MSIDFIINIAPNVLAKEIPTQKQCLAWFQAALLPEITQTEVTLKIVDKEEGALLNQQYRQKQGATNVLSFPYRVPGQPNNFLLGDLVICAALVKEEAMAQHKTQEAHWAHLVVHGALHLQGYDHIEKEEAELMEGLEVRILQQLGFPSPYGDMA
jgi:probable rRNA maturation factor